MSRSQQGGEGRMAGSGQSQGHPGKPYSETELSAFGNEKEVRAESQGN